MSAENRNASLVQKTHIATLMLRRVSRNLKRIALFLDRHHHGLVLLSGPMRAGKSTTLLNLIDILRDVSVLRVKPRRDDRQTGLMTHTGITADAHCVTAADELQELITRERPDFVIVDEAQFFDNAVLPILLETARRAIVVIGMLDRTFEPADWPLYSAILDRGKPMHGNSFLHIKLMGVCQLCGSMRGGYSRLMIEPPRNSTVLTGASIYTTTCRACHAPAPPPS